MVFFQVWQDISAFVSDKLELVQEAMQMPFGLPSIQACNKKETIIVIAEVTPTATPLGQKEPLITRQVTIGTKLYHTKRFGLFVTFHQGYGV